MQTQSDKAPRTDAIVQDGCHSPSQGKPPCDTMADSDLTTRSVTASSRPSDLGAASTYCDLRAIAIVRRTAIERQSPEESFARLSEAEGEVLLRVCAMLVRALNNGKFPSGEQICRVFLYSPKRTTKAERALDPVKPVHKDAEVAAQTQKLRDNAGRAATALVGRLFKRIEKIDNPDNPEPFGPAALVEKYLPKVEPEFIQTLANFLTENRAT